MRKLQIEDAGVMRIAIQQEIGRSAESRYDHRLHGLLLVTAGQSCRVVAQLFGEDGTTVQRWVRRFEQGGLDALREGERSGRAATLGAKDGRRLRGELRKEPRDFGLAATLWDGPILFRALASALRGGSGRAAMSAIVSTTGLSAAKASAPSRASPLLALARSACAPVNSFA